MTVDSHALLFGRRRAVMGDALLLINTRCRRISVGRLALGIGDDDCSPRGSEVLLDGAPDILAPDGTIAIELALEEIGVAKVEFVLPEHTGAREVGLETEEKRRLRLALRFLELGRGRPSGC